VRYVLFNFLQTERKLLKATIHFFRQYYLFSDIAMNTAYFVCYLLLAVVLHIFVGRQYQPSIYLFILFILFIY